MKLTIVFLVAFCFNAAARGFGQTLDLSEKNASLDKIFKEIRHQTGYTFIYTKEQLQRSKPVTINVHQANLERVLDLCFHDQPLSYGIVNNMIVIRDKENVRGDQKTAQPVPPITVTGKISNQNGEPLAGASISEKGKTNTIMTKEDGSFEINVTDSTAVLIISYVGYESKEIPVSNRKTISLALSPMNVNIENVVVTGYTSERRKDITGSVSVVNVNAMKSVPVGTGEQALQGQASGVTVISSGVPGGRSDVFIRGVSSFGNNQPLVIIDGIQSSLHDINVNDIESMQVLKDAGAASIYGVRGSNGVIVITTKKGKAGKLSLTYDAYYGVQVPPSGNVFHLLNSQEYATLVKKINPGTVLFPNGVPDYTYAGPNSSGVGNSGDPAVDPSKYNFDANNPANDYLIQQVNKQGTDWFHEIFHSAHMQSHNLSASGGTDKMRFLFSLSDFDQQGTLMETYLKRYSLRVNTQLHLSKAIHVGENLYFFYKKNPAFVNLNSFNSIAFTYRTLPVIPVYDINGNYGGSFDGPELGNGQNPVAIQQRSRDNKNNTWDLIGNVYGEVEFLKHFTARTSFGGTLDNQDLLNFTYNGYNDKEGHTGANGLSQSSIYNDSWTWTNTLRYQNEFGRHSVKALVGSEAIKNDNRFLTGSSNGFFSVDPSNFILGNGTFNFMTASSRFVNSLFSLFSRLDYAYDDKYLVSGTIRRDGSSQFGPNKRYGVFPSFSGAWRISRENFMKDLSFINDLKIRGSWGKLGSQNNIRPNNAYTLFSSSPQNSFYDINGLGTNPVQGFYQSANGNPNTSWEEDVITNVGVDATLFNNRVEFSIERYKKEINGLLFPQPLPYTAGTAAAPYVNIGNVRNKGWDITATYRSKNSTPFKYSISVNVTTYKNIVDSIPGKYFDVESSELGTLVRNQVGHPVGAFFGYQVERLFSSAADVAKSPTQDGAAPGRFKYKDVTGDGKITTDDRTFIGNPNPDFTYGVNLSLEYKGFDFTSIFYGSHGNDVFNYTRYFTDFYSTLVGNKSKNLLYNSWTPQNLNAKTPVAEFGNSFSTAGTPNSYFIEKGSFFKCRSMSLGYNFSNTVLQRLKVERLRVYVQATNVFMITQYSGLDPELTGNQDGSQASSSFGIDFGNYPNNQRSFLMGVSLSF